MSDYPEKSLTVERRAVVTQAIGKASMCWSETPAGIFDSDQAMEVVNDLLSYLDGGALPWWYQP